MTSHVTGWRETHQNGIRVPVVGRVGGGSGGSGRLSIGYAAPVACPESMKRFRRSTYLWVVLVLAVVFVGGSYLRQGPDVEDLDLNAFREKVANGEINSATIKDQSHEVTGELEDGSDYKVSYPAEFADELTAELSDARPSIDIETDQQQDSIWVSLLFSLLPLLILFGLFLFVINAMQGGGSRVMQFGKAKAKQFNKDQPRVTFDDVAGADEAVEELREIKDFLQDPAKFHAIGAKIPRGVLLVGPPGTGKTLLARAVAGEAGAPFFSISGSDFVEMFVGVGASGSVTCSNRPRPSRQRSCSSTRSTPSAATAAPAWAAVTTSVSRR